MNPLHTKHGNINWYNANQGWLCIKINHLNWVLLQRGIGVYLHILLSRCIQTSLVLYSLWTKTIEFAYHHGPYNICWFIGDEDNQVISHYSETLWGLVISRGVWVIIDSSNGLSAQNQLFNHWWFAVNYAARNKLHQNWKWNSNGVV